MRRGGVLLLLTLALAACGEAPAIPPVDLQLTVQADTENVELGRAFPVTVVRVWHTALEPEPFDDAMLAPLSLVLESSTRTEDGTRVMETRRFRAYAFTRRDVVVRSPVFRARSAEGEVRVAKADSLRLRVEPLLDPDATGEPELPGGPLPERTNWTPLWILLAVALAATATFGFVRRREHPGEAPPEPAPEPKRDGWAQVELDALRAEARDDPEALRATTYAIGRLARRFAAATYDLRTRERTTPEIVRAARGAASVPAPAREHLASLLPACDLVTFGAFPSSPAARDALFDEAERLIAVAPEARD
ncbi:MAG: hypothetical protein QNJ98_10930 [Planctomycetota bacterium]|nr:hypothetical protein [Planctomycetota bacterium]